MTVFLMATAACVALVLALIARPFIRIRPAAAVSRRRLNAAILLDQLQKLDQDRADGTLAEQDHAQARAELQRRVLEDTDVQDDLAAVRAPRRTLAALALVLPLSAFGLYYLVGNPLAMSTDATSQARAEQDVEKMIESLARKLEHEPGNLKGWAMLARSYKAMGRARDSELAFDKAGAFIDGDAQLLADYADVAASNAGGSFTGKPRALIQKALKADPDNAMALWLSGTADLNSKDYNPAIATWERLLALLPPASDDARMLQASLAETRALAGQPARTATPVAATAAALPAGGAGVSGTVEVATALRAKVGPEDILMVIARVPGSRMPVAVMRVKAIGLPLRFNLDDSLSMSPLALISTASEVEIEARISGTGQAMPQAGDLVSKVQTVKVGARNLALHVDEVRR